MSETVLNTCPGFTHLFLIKCYNFDSSNIALILQSWPMKQRKVMSLTQGLTSHLLGIGAWGSLAPGLLFSPTFCSVRNLSLEFFLFSKHLSFFFSFLASVHTFLLIYLPPPCSPFNPCWDLRQKASLFLTRLGTK